jgi:signal transduction histidine kinase
MLLFVDKILILTQLANLTLMLIFKMRPFLILLGIIIFLTGNVASQDLSYSKGMPFIKTYKAIDYDGESQNWAFTQNDDGIIFIGNTIGFIEYDGVSWRQFKPDNDGVPLSFARGSEGNIYTGGTGFIGELKSDSSGQIVFKSLAPNLPEGLIIDFVWSTHYLDGKTYFQNKSNIISWDGKTINIIESPSDIELTIKAGDRLFVDTKSGLYEMVNDELVVLPWAAQLANYTVRAINQVSSDSLLLGTYSNGLYLYTQGDLHYLDNATSDFFKKNLLPSSMLLPDGKIILASKKGGLLILNKDLSIYYRITDAGGLANSDIKNFFLDKDNNIWIGTDNGFSILEYPIEFTFFNSKLGVESTVEEIRLFQNKIIVGSFLGALEMHVKSSTDLLGDKPYAEFAKLKGSGLTNMAIFELNDKLLISTTNGTQLYDGQSIELFDEKEARKFYQSDRHENVVYAGYRNGCDVLLFEGERLSKRIPVAGLDAQIRGIAEDVDGTVWLGSLSNGVYQIIFDSEFGTADIIHYSEEDGLPSMRDNLIYRVGDKVVFTTHQGIFTFDPDTKRFIPDSTFGDIYANQSRFVYAFHFDDEENAWINSFRKKETALASLNKDGTYDTDVATFTPLRNMQVYDVYKEPSGAAWFGGSDGLARYQPVNYKPDKQLFTTKIRKVIVNNDSLLYYGHLNQEFTKPVLTAEYNEVRFETAAIYFDDGNRYQYLLNGYDDEWSSWSDEPFKFYTNLGQGDYTFQVRAMNIKGDVSAVDNFNFRILPPWYLTWWFLAFSFIIATIAMIYIVRYFATRKLIRRVEELELIQKAQKQRERISRDLHDNVGSNLTYIISSLDYLTYKSSDNEELTSKANSLSDFTRDTMHQLRDTIWHISSEAVTLEKFHNRVEELCLRLKEISDTTNCSIAINGNGEIVLPPLPALNLFRVIQEALNNAFKHARASNINVDISLNNSQLLRINIIDDGVGFEKNDIDTNGHYGLINLQTRMDDIGATIEIISGINKGTKVAVEIQL